MNPLTFSEYTKKYGNLFLMWVAIGYLYTELNSYKTELKEVRMDLYNCMELRAQGQRVSIFETPEKIYFDLPKRKKYGVKGNKSTLEI